MDDIYNQFREFKSFEVVFIDGNGDPQKLFCTVKSIESTIIELNANKERNKNIVADVGTELKLHIYTENGVYTATSKVLTMEKGLINTDYTISYPADSKHSQRREYFRADLMVDLKMNVVSNITNESFAIEAKTKNICGKGMSFVCDSELSKNDSFQVELKFEDRVVSTSANLVYSKQINFDTRTRYLLAFNFNDISTRDIDFIVKKCFLHQLALRKKQID